MTRLSQTLLHTQDDGRCAARDASSLETMMACSKWPWCKPKRVRRRLEDNGLLLPGGRIWGYSLCDPSRIRCWVCLNLAHAGRDAPSFSFVDRAYSNRNGDSHPDHIHLTFRKFETASSLLASLLISEVVVELLAIEVLTLGVLIPHPLSQWKEDT